MLDLPTPELPTSSACRGGEQLAQAVDPAAGLRLQDQGRHVDGAVDRADALGGVLTGEVGFGEQQQRLDLVLDRERDEPVDHRQVQRRVDQRRDDRDRVDVGRHRLRCGRRRCAAPARSCAARPRR